MTAPVTVEELAHLLGRLSSMSALERAVALRGQDCAAQQAVAAAYRQAVAEACREEVEVTVAVDGVSSTVWRRRTHAEVAGVLGVTPGSVGWAVGGGNPRRRRRSGPA